MWLTKRNVALGVSRQLMIGQSANGTRPVCQTERTTYDDQSAHRSKAGPLRPEEVLSSAELMRPIKGPGGRFSKDPVTCRARKAILETMIRLL